MKPTFQLWISIWETGFVLWHWFNVLRLNTSIDEPSVVVRGKRKEQKARASVAFVFNFDHMTNGERTGFSSDFAVRWTVMHTFDEIEIQTNQIERWHCLWRHATQYALRYLLGSCDIKEIYEHVSTLEYVGFSGKRICCDSSARVCVCVCFNDYHKVMVSQRSAHNFWYNV